MLGFVTFIHTLICILLVVVILMQSGRGGGLTEGFAPAESILGAKTNAFMIKTTTVLCILFFITCTGLALFSLKKEKSLMPNTAAMPAAASSKDDMTDMMKNVQAEADALSAEAAAVKAEFEKKIDSTEAQE